jgi:hypothetical protein
MHFELSLDTASETTARDCFIVHFTYSITRTGLSSRTSHNYPIH